MTNVTALEVRTRAERTADHERLGAALASVEQCYADARRLVFDVPLGLPATRPLTFLQRQSLARLQAAEEWLREIREQSLRTGPLPTASWAHPPGCPGLRVLRGPHDSGDRGASG